MSPNDFTPCDVLLIGQDTQSLANWLRALDHRVFPVSRLEVTQHMLKARSFDLLFLAGAPADAAMTSTIRAIRGLEEANAALAPLVVWDRLGGESQALLAAGADQVAEGPLDDDKLARLLNLRSETPPTGEILRLLQNTLGECQAELESASLTPSRLGDIAHRLKGSASSFSLPALAEAAREAMKAAQPGQNAERLLQRLRRETTLAIETVRARQMGNSGLPPA